MKKSNKKIKNKKGIYDSRNKLNNLNGKEWIKFTKSWFIFDALPKDLKEERGISAEAGLKSQDHPATYSPTMMENFISFFTKEEELVLDPFCGIGSTLVGCDRTNRKGIGVELNKKYVKIAKLRTKQKIITGNSKKIKEIWKNNNFPKVDFCISSPPYWDILNRSTSNFKKTRQENGFDINYSSEKIDLGNIDEYNIFLDEVCKIYEEIYKLMKDKAYICIIVKNIKKKGRLYPLAWDIAERLSKKFVLKDEKIWCQDKISLAPYGYPFAWASNIHHHYCIILRKEKNE